MISGLLAQVMWIEILLFLTLLSKGATAGTELDKDLIYDPRCMKDLMPVEHFDNEKGLMQIVSKAYVQRGKVFCKEEKVELPALTQHDDWVRWITFIRDVVYRGYATCGQFPSFYDRAFMALGNRRVQRNCSIIPEFCAECSLTCPHVNPDAYASHKEMLSWSTDSVDLKSEGRCQREWTTKNIERVWKTNQSWFMNVRHICEGCHEGECSSTVAQHLHNDLMSQLREKAPGREARALKKICLMPVLVGAFTAEALHLESRYNFFDMWLSLRLAAQQCSDVAVLVIILWSILCVAFFNTDSKARDLFDPYHESARRELADQLLNWLKRNLSTKKDRKRRMRGKKHAKWQNKKENVKKSKRRLPADAPVLQLRNGKIAGPRRGPAGRGGRRRGLN